MSDVGIATFAIGQGVSSFMTFLPKLTDVRKASRDDIGFKADLRVGELGGSVITLGVGIIVTILTNSKVPLAVSAFIVITMLVMYETVLRAEPVEERYDY